MNEHKKEEKKGKISSLMVILFCSCIINVICFYFSRYHHQKLLFGGALSRETNGLIGQVKQRFGEQKDQVEKKLENANGRLADAVAAAENRRNRLNLLNTDINNIGDTIDGISETSETNANKIKLEIDNDPKNIREFIRVYVNNKRNNGTEINFSENMYRKIFEEVLLNNDNVRKEVGNITKYEQYIDKQIANTFKELLPDNNQKRTSPLTFFGNLLGFIGAKSTTTNAPPLKKVNFLDDVDSDNNDEEEEEEAKDDNAEPLDEEAFANLEGQASQFVDQPTNLADELSVLVEPDAVNSDAVTATDMLREQNNLESE